MHAKLRNVIDWTELFCAFAEIIYPALGQSLSRIKSSGIVTRGACFIPENKRKQHKKRAEILVKKMPPGWRVFAFIEFMFSLPPSHRREIREGVETWRFNVNSGNFVIQPWPTPSPCQKSWLSSHTSQQR